MSSRRAVVTGGAGFIGSHLCIGLLQVDYEVTVLDDFSTGTRENLDAVGREAGRSPRVIEGDIRDPDTVGEALQGADVVFHLAAKTSVEESVQAPESVHSVNLSGTLGLLEGCRKAAVKQLIFASSTAVYGPQTVQPQHEELLPRPTSVYGATKLAGEHYCRVYSESYGLRTLSLRAFNVYGPRQPRDSDYAAVIPRFTEAFLAGEAPIIYGDGRQTRDFVFVQDVVRANLAAADSRLDNGCFNVATGTSCSLLELVSTLNRLTGRRLTPRHAPARLGEVRHSQGATERAREGLGFARQVSLEEGLRHTLDWYAARAGSR